MSEIRSQAAPARDELADVVIDTFFDATNVDEDAAAPIVDTGYAVADRLLAAGWSKPRTVNSTAELDALPVGSVVWTPALVGPVGHIFVKCAGMWIIPWHDTAEDPLEQNGSVTVIFTPGDAG